MNTRMYRHVALLAIAGTACAAPARPITYGSVPGKEYSSRFDMNAAGLPAPGQVLTWIGDTPVGNGVVFPSDEVDAIANVGDAFLQQVITDQFTMILSFSTSPSSGPNSLDVPNAPLWYSGATPEGSGRGVWATTANVDPGNMPVQVDGIEIWGPDTDSTHWSDLGDIGGAAVRSIYGGGLYFSSMELAAAINAPPGIAVDLDALMVNDFDGNPDYLGFGDFMLVSVAANGFYDGGEIWVITRNANGAPVGTFLRHGGVTWDTANNVGGLFGIGTEEIDGLEAVPGPSAVLLLGVGGLAAVRRRS
jgi:MYXO-CTERM domain-containing protein